MTLSKEIKDYIDSLFKDFKAENSIANGTRMPGSDTGENSLISGVNNAANAPHSAAIGSNNEVKLGANSAVALGDHSVAYSPYQLVHGKYNDYDANNIYAHIVGGGTDENEGRKNIYTLDWEGNAEFAGKVSFKNDIVPTEGKDLVNLDYMNKQIAIKFFPHTLSADGSKATIYVNDLDPFTLYKVKQEGQSQVLFAVKTETGRDVIFYVSDLLINRYNMFVGNKTSDSIVFYMDSSIYTINLKTGKLTKTEEEEINSGSGEPEDSNSISIDDGVVDVNSTWSSSKIAEMFNQINTVTDSSISKLEVQELYGGEYSLICHNNDGSKYNIQLPFFWALDEEKALEWNRVAFKLNSPAEYGESGQILSFEGINEHNEIVTKWIDPIKGSIINGGDINNSNGGVGDGTTGGDDEEHEDIFVADLNILAENVVYFNGNIRNAKQALDKLLYITPTITSFTADPPAGDYEIGSSINSVVFTWAVNKTVGSQSITDIGSIDPELRTATYTGNITSNKTFKLSITEHETLGTGSASRDLTYNFKNRVYWGVASAPESYDTSFILSLSSNRFATDRKGSFSANAGSGQYIYYCFPSSWGTPTFNVGGFDGGFELAATINFTNASGHTESYVIWKSENANLGSQTITVK